MERSEIRTGAVLAIVLASYTMIVLDISIVITALCSPVLGRLRPRHSPSRNPRSVSGGR